MVAIFNSLLYHLVAIFDSWPYQISKIEKDIFLNIIKLIELFLTFFQSVIKSKLPKV